MTDVTVDIPGAYFCTVEGCGVIQERGDLALSGYAGAPAVYKAWTEGRTIKRGKGEAFRLTIPAADAADALDCLIDYAETHLDGFNYGGMPDTYDIEAYREADAERQAIKRFLARTRAQRAAVTA